MQQLPKQYRTPEIYGDFWFNSDPIPLNALRGYVILLHFWDYTNLGSLRSLPYIQEWHKRYFGNGLVTIGIHTPEFPFAKDPVKVRSQITKLGIRHPIVMDNTFIIWGAFRNRVWPAKYLIDKDGFIRLIHEGEGLYQDFEHSIQSFLNESGYREHPLIMEPLRDGDRDGVICYKPTPEIFGGFQRGRVGNIEGSVPESTGHFDDPGVYLEGRFYLDGNWINTRDFLRLDETDGREGKVTFVYNGKEANIVAGPEGEKQFQVFVKQDDKSLTGQNKGDDISIDDQDRSYFLVTDAKLYNIVKNSEYGEHKVTLQTRSNGFALYSVSFVTCPVASVISFN